MDIWPIDWPTSINVTLEDPYHIQLAEMAAGNTMRMLTLYRVGGLPITVKPQTNACCKPFTGGQFGHSYLPFYPILLDSGAYANCFCGDGCGCDSRASVLLTPPVGKIVEVKIDGVVLSSASYRVEDGNRLVRTDGGTFPSCSWDDTFTVTYLNGYEVDVLGQAAGGILAAEYLKLLTNGTNKCRLPRGVTSITRQGMSFEVTTGMFPNGMTGIPEVDMYIMQWNPNGLRTRPMVYSLDTPNHRTTSWEV